MPHSLVTQLRFARSEFLRCLDGISEDDAARRLLPMNCISWMIGHLANLFLRERLAVNACIVDDTLECGVGLIFELAPALSVAGEVAESFTHGGLRLCSGLVDVGTELEGLRLHVDWDR